MKKRIILVLVIGIITSAAAIAQNTDKIGLSVNQWKSTPLPFLFSTTTLTPQDNHWNFTYSGGYGQNISGAFGYNGLEQKVSIKGYLGKRFTCIAFAGLGFPKGNIINSAEQVEVIRNFIGGKKAQGFRLGIGLGAARDYANVGSVLGRVVLGYQVNRWNLIGNVLFQHAFGPNRDPLDYITSLGFHYRLTNSLYCGIESVGEDIEGLWSPEAEGGAKVLVGPSVNWEPDNSRFSFALSGGPVMYLTHSKLIDPAALRQLPFQNGLTLRARIVFNLSGV